MRVLVLVLALSASGAAEAQTQWDHNGSVVSLYASGAARKFVYAAPRTGLPVTPGTLLFDGRRSGNSYTGTAYVFSSRCGPRGYQVSGSVSNDDRSVTLYGKAPLVNSSCQVVRYRDDVLAFNLIEPNAPSPTVQEAYQERVPTLVCLVPEFTEERKLTQRIDGNRATTIWVAQAINYLRAKYCAVIPVEPVAISRMPSGDGCMQDSGYYLGELVYWGECHE